MAVRGYNKRASFRQSRLSRAYPGSTHTSIVFPSKSRNRKRLFPPESVVIGSTSTPRASNHWCALVKLCAKNMTCRFSADSPAGSSTSETNRSLLEICRSMNGHPESYSRSSCVSRNPSFSLYQSLTAARFRTSIASRRRPAFASHLVSRAGIIGAWDFGGNWPHGTHILDSEKPSICQERLERGGALIRP